MVAERPFGRDAFRGQGRWLLLGCREEKGPLVHMIEENVVLGSPGPGEGCKSVEGSVMVFKMDSVT
jgi:hypothetical protein